LGGGWGGGGGGGGWFASIDIQHLMCYSWKSNLGIDEVKGGLEKIDWFRTIGSAKFGTHRRIHCVKDSKEETIKKRSKIVSRGEWLVGW